MKPLLLAVAIFSITSTFPLLKEKFDEKIEVTFEKGIEIIKSEGYRINKNLKWNDIKAGGIKVTEKSCKGFLQICKRLVADFGDLQIYLDAEVRVMWVYADPTANEPEREVYYAQFL